MRALFVDTSALYALLDVRDRYHAAAARVWREILEKENLVLMTSNYVVLETVALVQHRLGLEAVRVLQDDVLPVLTVVWVDKYLHESALTALLAAGKRHRSLVDWTSFELMRRYGLDAVFTFDRDFDEQGFRRIPREEGEAG